LAVGEEGGEEAAEDEGEEEEEEAGLVAWVIVGGCLWWRRVKEEEEDEEEEEGKMGTRKPDGGGDGDNGGGRRVVAEVTCSRRSRRQGRRTTARKGKERDARPLLIRVLLGDKGGDASADGKAAQGLVVSWCVGNGTTHIGNGNRGRGGCSSPAPSSMLSSLQGPAAAEAAGLLLLNRSSGLLSSISWDGARPEFVVWTRGRQQHTNDEVMMTLSEPGLPFAWLVALSGPCVQGFGGGDEEVCAWQEQGDIVGVSMWAGFCLCLMHWVDAGRKQDQCVNLPWVGFRGGK